MTKFEAATDFLKQRAAVGYSCPMPDYWLNFWKELQKHMSAGGDEPPKPLILGAWNIDNDATKHRRLKEQLEWAAANGCIEEALNSLQNLDDANWKWGAAEQWHTNWEGTMIDALQSEIDEND